MSSKKASRASDRDKMPVSISLLDSSLFDEPEFDPIVDYLTEGTVFEEQRLRPLYKRDHQVRLFYAREWKPARWVGFFKTVLVADQPMLKARNYITSFVCFVGGTGNTFVITGGMGKFLVQDYLNGNFGMDILVRLIKKDAPSVLSLQDRGVAGAVLGERRFFRGRQRLTDEDQFGKIYKEINAMLNKPILLKELGFSEAEIKKKAAGCWAKASFMIGKSIGFPKMLDIVNRLSVIRDKEPNFSLNSVKLISNRGEKNKLLLDELSMRLKFVLYEDCRQDRIPDFDFCHPDFETYLTAFSYRVEIDGDDDLITDEPIELADVIRHFKEKDRWTIDTPEEFDVGFLRRKLITYDDQGVEETMGTILDHLHGEISLKDGKYFFLDKQWYQIENTFITALNSQCQILIDKYLDEALLTLPYDIKKAEALYTDRYLGQEGCLVLDTITEEHIEACDLLIYNTEDLYLIHIKRGFNNSVRELAAQVSLAARRIAQDSQSDHSFIKAVGDKARAGGKSSSLRLQRIAGQAFPPGGLEGLFKGRKPNKIFFCLAFADQSEHIRHIKTDLASFESSMAKHSLLQLSQEVLKHGFQFRVIQLRRP